MAQNKTDPFFQKKFERRPSSPPVYMAFYFFLTQICNIGPDPNGHAMVMPRSCHEKQI